MPSRQTKEFQIVILAGGNGSRMYPLTEQVPKCLLPVGNRPLICYSVNMVAQQGFDDVIIITRSAWVQPVMLALEEDRSKLNIKIDCVGIPDDEELGTVDALLAVRKKIETDTFVISVDTLTDVPFHRLADVHRIHSASLTVLLVSVSEPPAQDLTQAKVPKKNNGPEHKDLVAVDSSDGRLVFIACEEDCEDDIVTVSRSVLRRRPHLQIRTDLMDAHVYILKCSLLDVLAEDKAQRGFDSLRSEFIPDIVRRQFRKSVVGDTVARPEAFEDDDTETYNQNGLHIRSGVEKVDVESLRCYAYVAQEYMCTRVNTITSYFGANREVTEWNKRMKLLPMASLAQSPALSQVKSRITPDSLVHESVTLGENLTIGRSIIGRSCTVGSRVKVFNSILMDNVVIKDGCTIQGSIVCPGSIVKENCSLRDCNVASKEVISEGSDLKGETYVTRDDDGMDD